MQKAANSWAEPPADGSKAPEEAARGAAGQGHFQDLISVFERIEAGEELEGNLSVSLQSLSKKYKISAKGGATPEKVGALGGGFGGGRTAIRRSSSRRQQNKSAQPVRTFMSQSTKELPRVSTANVRASSIGTPLVTFGGLDSAPATNKVNNLKRPSTVAARAVELSPTQSLALSIDEDANALDLFEDEGVPGDGGSGKSNSSSPSSPMPTSAASPTRLVIEKRKRDNDPSPMRLRHSRSRNSSKANPASGSPASPLPPILQTLNTNDDKYTSEFYDDIVNVDIASFYKTLNKRARTVHGTRRASTGVIEPNLSSIAQSDDLSIRFNMYTHTMAEARVLRPHTRDVRAQTTARNTRAQATARDARTQMGAHKHRAHTAGSATLNKKKKRSPNQNSSPKLSPTVESPRAVTSSTKKVKFLAPSVPSLSRTYSMSSFKTSPSTSNFSAIALLSRRTQSPYHEMHAMNEDTFNSTTRRRPNTVAVTSTHPVDTIFTNQTSKQMQENKNALQKSLRSLKSSERGLFYR